MSSTSHRLSWLAAAVLAIAWTVCPSPLVTPANTAFAQEAAEKATEAKAPEAKPDAAPDASSAKESAPEEQSDEKSDEKTDDSSTDDKAPEEKAPEEKPAEEKPESSDAPSDAAPSEAPGDEKTSGDSKTGEGDTTDSEITVEVAEGAEATSEGGSSDFMKVLVVLAVLILPLLLGTWLAKQLRVPELTWKVNLVLLTVAAGSLIVFYGVANDNITLGPDLKGGIKLVYEYQPKDGVPEKDQIPEAELADRMIKAIKERIDPSGVKELGLRTSGARRIEIIMPSVGDEELISLKRILSTTGALEFRITANRVDHEDLVEAALASNSRLVETGGLKGRWVTLDDPDITPNSGTYIVRSDRTPESGPEILLVLDEHNVTGEYLNKAGKGVDSLTGRPCINFGFNNAGATRFGRLTGENLPVEATGHRRMLGIILDNRLRSAPSINSIITDSGQITGNFSDEEIEEVVQVLDSGSMPAELAKEPETEQTVGPTLGADMVKKGKTAIMLSVAVVLVFMLIYYHFAGFVACLALVVNLVMILAFMISFRAAFTLPGLAGLVLTIGMSVDANVLIFERIREELNRGAALRMAIRNGFGRATTTIVDANLTTLITAIVLYVIGTAELKGFAVILILGILMSMYTAIFCSRVIFDIAEKRRWITKLSMLHIIGATNWNFLSWRKVAAVCSAVLIVGGMIGVAGRGSNLLGIDFTGGSSVTLKFQENKGLGIEEIRDLITEENGFHDASVVAVGEDNRMYSINSRTTGLKTAYLRFKPDVSVTPDEIKQKVIAAGFPAEETEVAPLADTPGGYSVVTKSKNFSEFKDKLAEAFKGQLIDDSFDGATLAIAEYSELEQIQEALKELFGDKLETYSITVEDLQLIGDGPKVTPVSFQENSNEESAEKDNTKSDDPSNNAYAGGTTTQLKFADGIMRDTVLGRILPLAKKAGHEEFLLDISHPEFNPDSPQRFTEWELKTSLPPAETEKLLAQLTSDLNSTPVFPSSSNIGGKVAGDTQTQAGMAIFLSLLFIVGYLWVRFQKVMFGLAAVVALVHDVLITLGILALSHYLVDGAPSLASLFMIDQFKISLPILAAFLTIIGYSLNDTIVVFDRIREVRGKSPTLTAEMINTSVNQTLSRTLLTSATTLIVVMILYLFGGEGIHGFAFALVVGVLVGTYSSVFVASPVLLWMSQSGDRAAARRKAATMGS